ncbi:MAG: hypothetical protein IPJ20_03565 [Flammeovirgaceae bacterium]|nr:hypothetical protein [Flammeovirgaceae bacterium]
MKRSASYIFLFILLINLVGGYLYFGVRMMKIHDEKRAELRTKDVSELEVITLSLKQFQKVLVEDGEMELNDKMYDIARTDIKSDSIIVYCLHDVDEDNLLSLLDSILSNSSKDKKPVPSSVLGFLSFISLPMRFMQACIEPIKENHNTVYFFSKGSSKALILGPPPKG